MNLVNWMEFAEFVPGQINTVLLPNGTFEPHGAENNGAVNTAPTAMARAIAEDLNALIAPYAQLWNYWKYGSFPQHISNHRRCLQTFHQRHSNRSCEKWLYPELQLINILDKTPKIL
ncbi:hypothetical protein U3A58_11060 [Algoriphagus sp. C2-6-M1]|uniref:hypothetical protein n=1 Tax=Algoriphagus persicinus TaxID=3108754 RepID=UPI002B3A1CFE|nr:hypothetical protein [Algoriphagus sp. C2-6-M1]MEB2780933.1 hypothetical protein [Algoriphagus sp. C2-6-M1]